MFFHYILPNRMLWLLAFANVFVYIARYAMVDWGPTYLKETKGASLTEGGFSTLIIEFAGIAGMLIMGWLSDKIGGRRARVSVLTMIPLMLAFGGLIFTGSLLLRPGDIRDPVALARQLASASHPLAGRVWSEFSDAARAQLTDAALPESRRAAVLTEELNRWLKSEEAIESLPLEGIRLRERTGALLARQPHGTERVYLKRLLLEDAWPEQIARCRFTPRGLLWTNLALFAVIGFLVYTPVMFSGVMALDLTSKKAAATAPGFVGLFGYVGGRVIQGKGLGVIAQNYGWDMGLYAVIGCVFLGTVLLALLWNARPRG